MGNVHEGSGVRQSRSRRIGLVAVAALTGCSTVGRDASVIHRADHGAGTDSVVVARVAGPEGARDGRASCSPPPNFGTSTMAARGNRVVAKAGSGDLHPSGRDATAGSTAAGLRLHAIGRGGRRQAGRTGSWLQGATSCDCARSIPPARAARATSPSACRPPAAPMSRHFRHHLRCAGAGCRIGAEPADETRWRRLCWPRTTRAPGCRWRGSPEPIRLAWRISTGCRRRPCPPSASIRGAGPPQLTGRPSPRRVRCRPHRPHRRTRPPDRAARPRTGPRRG